MLVLNNESEESMTATVKFKTCIGQAASDITGTRYCLNNVLVGNGTAMASDGRMAAFVTVESNGIDDDGCMMIPRALVPKSKVDLRATWSANGEGCAHVSRTKPNKPSETALAEDMRYPRLSEVIPEIQIGDEPTIITLDAHLLARIATAINPPGDADYSDGLVTLLIQRRHSKRDWAIGVLGNAKSDGLGVLMPMNTSDHGNAMDNRIALDEYDRRRKLHSSKADRAITAWAMKGAKKGE